MDKVARFIVKNRIIIYIVMLFITFFSAIMIPRVQINYELADYLPEDSETAQTLRRMEEEYGDSGVLFMMIKDVSREDAESYVSKIESIDYVESVSFDREDANYYSDFNALYTINLSVDNYAEEVTYVIDDLTIEFDDYRIYFDGPAYVNQEVENIIGIEMPLIIILAVGITLLILTFSARSYVEPFIFLGVVMVAVIINLGTNIIFDDISYITRSVAAVLQLGLSMDYSIMLLNRYHETLKETTDHESAMIKALSGSFRPISASSMTTVAGMVALMLMSYGIGFDIGSVLAKGIVFSLISVFVLMPGLLVTFHKLYERFKKRSMAPRNGPFLTLAFKTRKVMPFILFFLVIGSFFLQIQNEFRFSDEIEIASRDEVRQFFSQNRQVLLIYEDEDDFEAKESQMIERLEALEIDGQRPLQSSTAITTTALRRLDSETLTDLMDADEEMVETLFGIYAMEQGDIFEAVNTQSLIAFLDTLRDDPYFNEFLDESIKEDIDRLYAFIDHLENAYDYEEAAEILETENQEMLALYYAYENEDFDFNASQAQQTATIIAAILFGDFDTSMTIPFDSLMRFIDERIEQGDIEVDSGTKTQVELLVGLKDHLDGTITKDDFNELSGFDSIYSKVVFGFYHSQNTLESDYKVQAEPLFRLVDDLRSDYEFIYSALSPKEHEAIDDLLKEFERANTSLKGIETRRMLFTFDLPSEGENTSKAIESMRSITSDVFGENASLAGEIISTNDIEESFYGDYILIALITVMAIFILVFIAFRNYLIPIILVFVIQGAIWLSMGINVIMGSPIFFLSYLMVIAIQMGATVDYGILITSNYLEQRLKHPKYNAMKIAIKQSLPTVFTSGLILITAGLSVGFISSISSISEVGILLGRGATISIIFVTIVLPSILLAFDRFIFKAMLIKSDKKNAE